MKNYFKKFSIMFVMSIILIFGLCIDVFASDNLPYEIGTANYNNSVQNSAVVGVELLSPEKGWKRYDDVVVSNASIKTGNWLFGKLPVVDWGDGSYKDTATSVTDSHASNTFEFYGNKFRLYSRTYINRANDTKVIIDGEEQIVSQRYDSGGCRLIFCKDSLDTKQHTVTFVSGTNGSLCNFTFDCIDINENGYLMQPEISLSKSSDNIQIGKNDILAVTTTPASANIVWTSSDESVATVDSSGNVIAVGEGTCTITAAMNKTNISASCTNVTPQTVSTSGITINKASDSLVIGQVDNLIATATPSNATITWTSSDSSIATVDSTGKVTGVKEGQATITATTANGLTATCIVNVTPKEIESNSNPEPTDSDKIVNIAHAKGDNTNNAGGGVTIIFKGIAEAQLSVVKTADVDSVYVGDVFTYTIVVTNTSTKTAKAVVVSDTAPNHIDFNVSGITTTQGKVDPSSTSKNIIVNIGDIPPSGKVTIKIPATVIL